MRLCSFRMRAISTFIFDAGISTRRCFAPQALRIRVNMSAIGSVMLIVGPYVLSYPWTWRVIERGRGARSLVELERVLQPENAPRCVLTLATSWPSALQGSFPRATVGGNR